ncbi:ABC-type cobalamin/Fe3+-siderophore transport system, ATPase component [Thermanaerovibrio velox DSM 12556]|uniref:ABC-type cobalamin/Fe3+-siderophore transport system, ATPase component n=1 Tax=Thermanaerovibrio velox DSM 12556 TaxID=926567 RepID=H0UNT8_9BACT|nr:ABC transporter ATP-binding protein [Thermanaerovibrio velox]EHM09424.1 ABC-type cobalamin/Fe3+-siderophore transport system, ATPase component [Thermanaerovibrio velox DSM 12556]
MSIVSVRDLTVQMGGRTILRDVNLDLRPREALAVIGPNGAGKSTLLKALMGLVPFDGEAWILGRPLRAMRPREIGRHIAMVPQPSEGRPPVTPRELAELSRYPWHGPFDPLGPEDLDTVRRALAAVGLKDLADTPMEELSGGEAQRGLIAAALAQGTRCLLLDEPTAFLDHLHQQEVFNLLMALKDDGLGGRKGMLMVTHDVNLALAWADRVLAIKNGELLFDLPPHLIGPAELEGVFNVPFAKLTDPRGRGCLMPEVMLR